MRSTNSPKIALSEAYNHRDVMDLKPLTLWSPREEQISLMQNRILQSGFLSRDPIEFLNDAKKAKISWLTDYACPSVSTSLFLNLAKEMVLTYKINDNDLNKKAQESFNTLIASNPDLINSLNTSIEQQLRLLLKTKDLTKEAIQHLNEANQSHENSYPQDVIEATSRLIVDQYKKEITNATLSITVKSILPTIEEELELTKKTQHTIGTTNDYCLLGAAGSGKSTISNRFLTETDKLDHVTLATDNYRCFSLPGTEAFERSPTQDVFTRTQDLAYMVKELVVTDLKKKHNSRPNIIFDGITLDKDIRNLFNQGGHVNSVMAAFIGSGLVGIAERADSRAKNPNAAPADRGRFANTTALLEGHKKASKFLISSCPREVRTKIYDTRGVTSEPLLIASLDDKNHNLEIHNLLLMSSFINKMNLNSAAEHPIELILNSDKRSSSPLISSSELKAQSIIDLVAQAPNNQHYSITLEHKKIPYLKLEYKDGKVISTALNSIIILDKLKNKDSIESAVLSSIIKNTSIRQLNISYHHNSTKAINPRASIISKTIHSKQRRSAR